MCTMRITSMHTISNWMVMNRMRTRTPTGAIFRKVQWLFRSAGMRLARLHPGQLNVVLHHVIDFFHRNAEQFIDVAVAHAEEEAVTSVGGAPGDTVDVGMVVLTFISET